MILLRVKLLNHIPILLINHSSLHFQRRREFAAFDRELILQQRDLLDPLILRQVRSQAVNLSLNQIDDARMPAKLAATLYFNPFQLAVRLELLPDRHDQRRRKLALRSNQHHLVHKPRAFDRLFDRLRRNVLAAGSLEQLFLAIGDAQKAVFIERADVACLEPTIARENRARLFGLVVIAAHHVWTTHFDLAVFRNADFNVRNRRADCADAIVFDAAGGDDRRRFRQSVTLNDRNARADVDVRQIFRQRSAA